MQAMTIGQLADAAQGTSTYPAEALTRPGFIKRAQSLGFLLEDVQTLVSLEDDRACSAARAIDEHKLADVQQRHKDLRWLEQALQELVRRCSTSKGKVACPLIEALTSSPQG
jgi:MerR family transcriptional regulator, mercuric resistance operon regulatory protein